MTARRAAESDHFGDAITASVSQLLWKLQALGWVQPVDSGFAITAEGNAALLADSTG